MRISALRDVLALALAAATDAGCHGADAPPPQAAGSAVVAPAAPPVPAAPAEALRAPFPCTAAFDELRRSLGVDYLERRGWRGVGTAPVAAATSGVACEHAADRAACAARLAALAPADYLWRSGGGHAESEAALVLTRGDDVRAIGTRAQLLAAMGPIDTFAEAYYLADIDGYQIACDKPWGRATASGYEVASVRLLSDCPMTVANVRVAIDRDGTFHELESKVTESGECAGRRPPGLRPARVAHAASAVGAYFAAIARLEAASVVAFDMLATELVAHAAPARLVAAARRARRDEVAHAAVTGRLARRFGATVEAPRVARGRVRSLRALALDNAREGCVRETWGALEASWQARAAADAGVRRALRGIARDETRHAALSWQLGRWLEPRLSPRDRRAVGAARTAAVAELAEQLAAERSPAVVALAGVPDRRATAALFGALAAQLWA